jgi:hypothetical protein
MGKPASFYFFRRKPTVRKDRHETWREVADLLGLKTQERLRVEWMVFYYTVGKENATRTTSNTAFQPQKRIMASLQSKP